MAAQIFEFGSQQWVTQSADPSRFSTQPKGSLIPALANSVQTVKQGDFVGGDVNNNVNRCDAFLPPEVLPCNQGTDAWYGWAFQTAADFKPYNPSGSGFPWYTIMDFHETGTGKHGPFTLMIMGDDLGYWIDLAGGDANNQNLQRIRVADFHAGQTVIVYLRLKWSPTSGLIDMWWNGQHVVQNLARPVGFAPPDNCYIKLANYRPNDTPTNTIRHSSLIVAASKEELQPFFETAPAPPTDLISQAINELKMTQTGYINWSWKTPPVGSHWAKALALLARAKG